MTLKLVKLDNIILVNLLQADKERRKVMAQAPDCATRVAAKALHIKDKTEMANLTNKLREAHLTDSGNALKDLDLCMKGETDEFQNQIAT